MPNDYANILLEERVIFINRLVALGAIVLLLVACVHSDEMIDGSALDETTLTGTVSGSGQPVVGSKVRLFVTTDKSPDQVGETVYTDANGYFSIAITTALTNPKAVLYALVEGGTVVPGFANDAIKLMTMVGPVSNYPENIAVTESTTIASIWTSAQLLQDQGLNLMGNAIGKYNAVLNVRNFVDIETGVFADDVWNTAMAGPTTVAARFGSLANILAACIASTDADTICDDILQAATLPGQSVPENIIAAFQSIAKNPWHNTDEIFELMPVLPEDELYYYMPVLNVAPDAWVLALLFYGGGAYASGNATFDDEGNYWVNNNFRPGAIASGTCSNLHTVALGVTKLSPQGRPLSPSPLGYTGGGISGPGFGIARDRTNNRLWIGNFGTQSVSLFNDDGSHVSPDSGYPASGAVQGMAVDSEGSLWFVAEHNNRDGSSYDSLNVYRNGDPDQHEVFTSGLNRPFGLAIAPIQDLIYVSNQDGQSVSMYKKTGELVYETEPECCGFHGPRGLQVDSLGNSWIANFGRDGTGLDSTGVTMLDPMGLNVPGSPFGKGTVGPWGVTVDGADNIWIADFNGRGIANLCGANPDNCPPGFTTGDPISPVLEGRAGYNGGYATQSLISAIVDHAGNVWATNNVDLRIPGALTSQDAPECETSTPNYAGQGIVVFYGIATPGGSNVELN